MDVPLTPIVVDVVTFDRAPLGRRGYNEDQVDDFLDRVQATLAGEDTLAAHEVRAVEFDPAPFIRRGYHEDQVDEFLDLVVEELDRREGNAPATPATGGLPWSRHAPGSAGQPAGLHGSGNAPGTSTPPGGTPASGSYPTPGYPGNTPYPAAGGAHGHSRNAPTTGGTPDSGSAPAGTPAYSTPGSSSAPGSPGGTPGNTAASGSTPGPHGNAPTSGGASGSGSMPGSPAYPAPGGTPGNAPATYPTPGSSPAGASGHSGSAPTAGGAPGPTTYPTPAGTPGHSGNNPGYPGPNPGGTNPPAGAGSPGAPDSGFPDPIAWLPFPPAQPRTAPPLTPAELTNPMLFAQPPSWPSPSTQPGTQPVPREEEDASGPPESSVAATTDTTGDPQETEPDESPVRPHSPSVAAGQAASALRAGVVPDGVEAPEAGSLATPKRTLADYAPTQEPAEEAPEVELSFPLPPAPPGEPGYAPSDVARLMKLLTTAPDREQLTDITFSLTTTGGYHTGTVDALRQAWIDALPTKQP